MSRSVPASAVDALVAKLRACVNGGEVHPILRKLKRSGPEHRDRVVDHGLGRGCGQGIALFGADELVPGQSGYSFDPVADAGIDDWNSAHVVIAAEAGDPYVLDLNAVRRGDCPVLHARHGQGSWTFEQVTARFVSFLVLLAG